MKKFVHVLKEKLNQGSSQDYVRQQQTPYNHPSQATLLPISGFVLEEILQWNASKFAIFHVLEVVVSSIFHFMLCIILFFTIMSWSMSLCVNIDLCIQSEVARNEIGKGKSMTNFVGTFC